VKSPQFSRFEIRNVNNEATLQERKDRAIAEMTEKIKAATGAKDVRFTFYKLTREAPTDLVANQTWEVRAEF
jgi:hypothetical protein